MPAPAPAPRLPLEPADRPLYRPQARFGCSGVTLVSVITLLAFLFFLRVVAPQVTTRIAAVELPAPLRAVLDQPTATPTPGTAALAAGVTPLPAPQLTPTLEAAGPPAATPVPAAPPPAPATTVAPTPAPPAPPAPESVQVANTGGTGVWLRADPRADGRRVVAMVEKTVLVVAGPDTTVDGKVWRNVRTTRDPLQTGWVLAQYLAPAAGP